MARRSVIVTGASRGIGASTARALARAGYGVGVNFSNDETGAARVVRQIQGEGGLARAVRADVSIEADVLRLFDEVERELGPIGALVNNAGVTGGLSRVDALDAAVLKQVFAVNVIGAFLCSREAVKRMSRRNGGSGGSIVNLSSRAAELGGPGEWVHYAASKGAIDSLTIGLAREVADEGIRVNAVAPGLIETDLHAAAGDPDRPTRLAASIPIRRAGTADEVASAVLWLMSKEAHYVTGAILPVSGGR